MNTRFEITITIVIFLNMVVMMMDYLPSPSTDKGVVQNGTFVLFPENVEAVSTKFSHFQSFYYFYLLLLVCTELSVTFVSVYRKIYILE